MTDLYIPDVSEYQGSIDWKRLVAAGYPVAIVRAHNGYRADRQWAANRSGAHAANVRALGIYQYVAAGRDVVAQANELCDLIGALKPGEWPICDLEEGSGDQSARAHAWYTTVASRLHGASEELYSGDYFFGAHHLSAAGFKRIWIAAYSSHEPSTPHELWQFTDARSFPGVPGSNDASVFHGTVDELLSVINPPAPKPPTPPPPRTPKELDMIMVTVNRSDVPKGTNWPGDFLLADGKLNHIATTADEASFKAAGIPGPVTISWAQYQSLLAGK